MSLARHPLMLMLLVMPVHLLFCGMWMPDQPMLWTAAPGIYLILACLCLLPRGSARLACGLLSCAVLAVMSLLLLPWRQLPGVLLIPALYAFLLLFFLKVGGWTAEMELPVALCLSGLVLYILLQFYLNVSQPRYSGIEPALQTSFLVYLLLVLLMMNRISIHTAMLQADRKPPQQLRKRNLLLVWVSFGVIVIISLLPVIGQGLVWIWNSLLQFLQWISQLFTLEEGTIAPGAGGIGSMDVPPQAEASAPSLLAVILQKVFIVLSVLGSLALAAVILRILWRKLKQLFRMVMEGLRLYSTAAAMDYVDEAVDTRTQDGRTSIGLQLHRHKPARIELNGLPPRERIRAVYRLLRSRQKEWDPAKTARDTLSPQAAVLYEQARYSDHEISAEESQTFEKLSRKG